MKKTIIISGFLGVSFLVVLSGCSVPFDFFGITGSGNMISKDVEVSGFSGISLAGQGNLYIKQGSVEALEIEAEDNIMDLIVVDVKGDVLDIRYKKTSFRSTRDINFNIRLKDLNSIKISGSGKVIADTIETDDMDFAINGSGKVDMKLFARAVKTRISGSGKFNLSGQADSQELIISGSGKYLARNFKTKKSVIDVSGSGNAEVNVVDDLDVSISGSGQVDYIGQPSIKQSVSGSGRINQIKGGGVDGADPISGGTGQDEPLIGGERDERGCLGPAGYRWNEEAGACIREWELNKNQRKAAGIAVDYLQSDKGATILEVLVARCPGCFTVKLELGEGRDRKTVTLENWEVIDTSLTPEECEARGGRSVNTVGGGGCSAKEENIGEVAGFISPNICCVPE